METDINWAAFAIMFAFILLCVWMVPSIPFFQRLFLTLCGGGITFLIIRKQAQ